MAKAVSAKLFEEPLDWHTKRSRELVKFRSGNPICPAFVATQLIDGKSHRRSKRSLAALLVKPFGSEGFTHHPVNFRTSGHPPLIG